MARRTILVAGGGTGGHVFPGIAVAQALCELADVEIVFVGSPRGLETRVVPQHGFSLELLDVEPIKGGGPARAIRGALVAAKAMRRATAVVRRLRPAAALSVGGYAAGPASLACVSLRVPLAILEPNSTLGLSNRVVAPFARHAYVAWNETARVFRGDKARLHGVPLRAGFGARAYAPSTEAPRVLVLGGSQGAKALNERLPGAVARAIDARVRAGRAANEKAGEIFVVHQAGRDRDAAVREAYERAGVRTVTVAPFLDDVAEQMAAADLVVARSGAVTVAEIASIGRPSLLVPFPHAADDHQAYNAMALAALGGAVFLRQEAADEARLGDEIAALLADPERRARMAAAAREHGRPHAARDIAHDLLGLAGVAERARAKKANGMVNGSSTLRVDKEVS